MYPQRHSCCFLRATLLSSCSDECSCQKRGCLRSQRYLYREKRGFDQTANRFFCRRWMMVIFRRSIITTASKPTIADYKFFPVGNVHITRFQSSILARSWRRRGLNMSLNSNWNAPAQQRISMSLSSNWRKKSQRHRGKRQMQRLLHLRYARMGCWASGKNSMLVILLATAFILWSVTHIWSLFFRWSGDRVRGSSIH